MNNERLMCNVSDAEFRQVMNENTDDTLAA